MTTKKEYLDALSNFKIVSDLAERIFIQLVQSDDLVGEKERRGRDNKEIAEMAFDAAVKFLSVKRDYLLELEEKI